MGWGIDFQKRRERGEWANKKWKELNFQIREDRGVSTKNGRKGRKVPKKGKEGSGVYKGRELTTKKRRGRED